MTSLLDFIGRILNWLIFRITYLIILSFNIKISTLLLDKLCKNFITKLSH